MCEFCNSLEYRTYRVLQRTTSADDNQCVFGSPLRYIDEVIEGEYSCDTCINGCSDKNLRFELTSWKNYISLGYIHRINNIIIEPYSEAIKINYCPWCGKQLTENLVDFNECHCGNSLKLIEEK